MTNREISKFLSSTTVNATFTQKLKIKYRPFICPFDELLDYAKGAKSVYDIGCGSGQFCALVANYTDVKKIKGIEIRQDLIDNANIMTKQLKKSKDISFEVFDGITFPKDIASYEVVYMIDVYHHIPLDIRDEFMKKLYKQMKRGATLVFKDIDADSKLVGFNKVHDYTFSREFGNEISHKNATKMLKKLGFSVKSTKRENSFVYPHYFTIVQK